VKRNFVVIAVLVAALALMLWTGIRQSRSVRSGEGVRVGAVKGKIAPEFELQDLNGNIIHLSDYRGKAVLLNFWATWCAPCKEEMPWFVDLQNKYGTQGLQVIGVAMDDAGRDAIAKFSKEMGVNYAILLGTEKVADAYGGVEALPTTFYISRDGKIVSRVFGLATHGEIEDKIKTTLSQQGSAMGIPASAQNLSASGPGVQR